MAVVRTCEVAVEQVPLDVGVWVLCGYRSVKSMWLSLFQRLVDCKIIHDETHTAFCLTH
jgi:hypothetical protein